MKDFVTYVNSIYIPYAEAKELNNLGYDMYVEYYKDSDEEFYDMRTPDDAPCILWQNAFKWFREEHGLWFRPDYYDEGRSDYTGSIHELGKYSALDNLDEYDSVESLELEVVRKLIEIVKKK
jgi:hypothetical protein